MLRDQAVACVRFGDIEDADRRRQAIGGPAEATLTVPFGDVHHLASVWLSGSWFLSGAAP
jgi:hypothetical protein